MSNTYLGRFNVSTGVSTTQISVTGVGFKPTAIVFMWNNRTGNSGGRGSVYQSLGFVDENLNQYCNCTYGEHGVDGGHSNQYASDHEVAYMMNHITLNMGSFKVISLDSDGFTYEIEDQWVGSYRFMFMAIECDASFVGNFNTPASTGNDTISGVGFEGDAVLITHIHTTAFNSRFVHAYNHLGVATASDEQWSQFMRYTNQQDPEAMYRGTQTNRIIDVIGDIEASFSSFNSDGFVLNYVDAGLALKNMFMVLKGGDFYAGSFTSSSGSQAVSGVGFEPEAILNCGVREHILAAGAFESAHDQGDPMGFSIGMATEQDGVVQGAWGGHHVDGLTGAGRGEVHQRDDYFIYEYNRDNSPAQNADATFTSLDVDGFTIQWTDPEDVGSIEQCFLALAPAVIGGVLFMNELTLASSIPNGIVLPGEAITSLSELTLASALISSTVVANVFLSMNELALASLAVWANAYITPGVYSRNFIRPRARGFINIPISKTTKQ